ncbi:hypothetical protein MNBD_NITROSPINAE04-2063 [hydrothermal vent metagenome]|uniref:Molybdopterin-guanine dinucleotide biosynthesis protein B (MobB) domain-containing protein n=1 Tax=hydrothermal vent metagenome TaxID=652676 RepID=A0A3B1BH43_9ZZZZ
MDSAPPMIAFIGPSGSGKTTLIEKLIKKLRSDGIRVGAIKRSHHEIDIDKKGKDSYRLRQAGSNPTVAASENFIGFMEQTDEPVALADLARQFHGKADIIMVEGFKNESCSGAKVHRLMFGPPFEVCGDNGGKDDDSIAGFITAGVDAEQETDKPLFQRDDVEALAGWIKRNSLNLK